MTPGSMNTFLNQWSGRAMAAYFAQRPPMAGSVPGQAREAVKMRERLVRRESPPYQEILGIIASSIGPRQSTKVPYASSASRLMRGERPAVVGGRAAPGRA